MAEEPKSWWQTAAGLMTAVAALMTAFTGLLVALHQIRKDSGEGKHSDTGQLASPHDASLGNSSKGAEGGRKATSTQASSVGEDTRTPLGRGPPRIANPPLVVRPAYAVALPATHEFVLGAGLQTGRFIVTRARLESHTVESDILKVSVQVLVDGQQPFPFNNQQFELRIDEQPYRSTTFFNEYIPVGQSRDHEVHFTIPYGSTRAVLWIHEWLSNAEIPLDLTPPK